MTVRHGLTLSTRVVSRIPAPAGDLYCKTVLPFVLSKFWPHLDLYCRTVRPTAVPFRAQGFVHNFLPIAIQLATAFAAMGLPISAQGVPAHTAEVRPCKLADQERPSGNKIAKQKKHSSRSSDSARTDACLELRLPPLTVQERLQEFVREQRWLVGDQEISESLWTFSRELSREELSEVAKPYPLTERVNWTRGRAIVLIRTVELGDGFTRAEARADFAGFGEPEDKFAMQRSSWKLASTGRLESTLLNALQTRSPANR